MLEQIGERARHLGDGRSHRGCLFIVLCGHGWILSGSARSLESPHVRQNALGAVGDLCGRRRRRVWGKVAQLKVKDAMMAGSIVLKLEPLRLRGA